MVFNIYHLWYFTGNIMVFGVCGVTLACASTPRKLKNLPDHGGNRTRDLWDTSPTIAQLVGHRTSIPKVAGVRQSSQLAQC